MTADARKRSRSIVLLGAVAVIAIAVAWTASAQTSQGIGDRGQVLHQDVVAPKGAKAADGLAAIFGNKPAEGQNPSAFASGSKILPAPPKDASQAKGEPVLGRGGVGADRDTSARPDYQTGPDSTLQYVTVFNPSVIPFKRMSAVDRVKTDYTLYTKSHTRAALRVGGRRSASRDLFWGSVVLQFETGEDVPIPSVAPDMRILSYEVSPDLRAPLSFSKDDADNYFVRTDETGISGKYRLVFMVDADARHFTGQLPMGYRVLDVTRKGRSLVQDLPANVRAIAQRALNRLGVNRQMPLKTAVDKLVTYFRSYEAKTPPPSTGDIYWDLFTSQAGVCRHRSFVFMVTANALGLPTRYVTNEAHAWVEIWVPEVKWIRIDLGGAALNMEVSNAKGKTIYKPRQKDAFPRPDKYANNYTQLRGNISGLSSNQLAEAHTDNDPGTTPGWDIDDPDPDKGDPNAPRIGPGKSLPSQSDKDRQGKTATEITVDPSVAPIGFRGESITVSGRLFDDAGSGVGDQIITIWLAVSGRGGDDAEFVGTGKTDKDGYYRVDVELPKHLNLRAYEVYASTEGDKKYAASVSQ